MIFFFSHPGARSLPHFRERFLQRTLVDCLESPTSPLLFGTSWFTPSMAALSKLDGAETPETLNHHKTVFADEAPWFASWRAASVSLHCTVNCGLVSWGGIEPIGPEEGSHGFSAVSRDFFHALIFHLLLGTVPRTVWHQHGSFSYLSESFFLCSLPVWLARTRSGRVSKPPLSGFISNVLGDSQRCAWFFAAFFAWGCSCFKGFQAFSWLILAPLLSLDELLVLFDTSLGGIFNINSLSLRGVCGDRPHFRRCWFLGLLPRPQLPETHRPLRAEFLLSKYKATSSF